MCPCQYVGAQNAARATGHNFVERTCCKSDLDHGSPVLQQPVQEPARQAMLRSRTMIRLLASIQAVRSYLDEHDGVCYQGLNMVGASAVHRSGLSPAGSAWPRDWILRVTTRCNGPAENRQSRSFRCEP